MKKIVLILLLIIGCQAFGQIPGIPDSINYQAVLRDGAGNVLAPGTNGTLNFQLFSDFASGSPDYEENHSFTTNAVGLVHLYIGGGNKVGSNTMANVNWAAGSACYEVKLNGTLIGNRQAFASVPYALYAKTSGSGSMPAGLINQTLYWNGPLNKWVPTNNLNNNGTNVGIGISASGSGNKLNVFTSDPLDTTVILSVKNSAKGRDAAIRAYAYGLTNSSTPTMTESIFGSDNIGANSGTGPGVGVQGIGVSSGFAYGVVGIASANSPTAYAIGLYGGVANGSSNPNNYSAYLDGKTYIGDSALYFLPTSIPINRVLTMQPGGRAAWRPLAPSSSITINQGGIVSVTPSGIPSTSFNINAPAPLFSSSNIGNITSSGYPNYQLNIPSPSFSFNPNTGVFSYLQSPFSTSISLSPSLTLSGSTLTAAGNSVNIPALNYWSRPTATAIELGFTNDNVGIGTSNPTEKLVVQTGANVEVSFLATPLNSAWINLGSTVTHTLGRIGYNTNNQSMSFWTNNAADRLFINSTGNVGIATNVPTAKLDINGDFKLGTTGNILTKVIGGQATPIVNTINPNTNLPFSFAAPGAAVGDRVVVTLAGGTSTQVFLGSATVSAVNQITVNLFNVGATASPGGTYTFNFIIYK